MGQPLGGNVLSIWMRDHKVCHLCGWAVAAIDASRDHVEPKYFGGPDSARNFALAHKNCNAARGRMPMDLVREVIAAEVERLGVARLSHHQVLNVLRVASKAWHRANVPAALPRANQPAPGRARFPEADSPLKLSARNGQSIIEWDEEQGRYVYGPAHVDMVRRARARAAR